MGTMTGVEMYAALLANLGNRSSTDIPAATALPWFNWTIDHVASPRIYRHRELEQTTTQALATGTGAYTIAAATGVLTLAVDSVVIYDPNNVLRRIRLRPLRSRDAHEQSGRYPSSEPYWYSWWGSTQIELLPAPDSAHNGWTLSIRRIKEPTLFTSGNLTSGSVTTILAREWDEVIVQGATWRGFRGLREWERAEQAKREFGQLINEVAERSAVEHEDVDFGPPLVLEESM